MTIPKCRQSYICDQNVILVFEYFGLLCYAPWWRLLVYVIVLLLFWCVTIVIDFHQTWQKTRLINFEVVHSPHKIVKPWKYCWIFTLIITLELRDFFCMLVSDLLFQSSDFLMQFPKYPHFEATHVFVNGKKIKLFLSDNLQE